ncbi:DNA damage-inducible protein I [Klebsiella pneumoniae]|nr:DNA damage-inducible protein I [Klebsiella pneumoniae]HBV7394305.1 DNA damage-inducible protein I [Klebsiella pneumoniae]HBV7577640.1 DNA damage-inducible protein I [Klebsiella pneumoniae]HBW8848037.1 DNA damage-inducible protein I [Klebsiella pneumoniae]
MRIEVSIAKTTALSNGALEALNNELSRRIAEQFPAIDSQVSVRYATGNQLSVFGALKEDKDRISEILQETWESADDWFVHDLS